MNKLLEGWCIEIKSGFMQIKMSHAALFDLPLIHVGFGCLACHDGGSTPSLSGHVLICYSGIPSLDTDYVFIMLQ